MAVLATRLPWASIEATLAPVLAGRAGGTATDITAAWASKRRQHATRARCHRRICASIAVILRSNLPNVIEHAHQQLSERQIAASRDCGTDRGLVVSTARTCRPLPDQLRNRPSSLNPAPVEPARPQKSSPDHLAADHRKHTGWGNLLRGFWGNYARC